MSNIFNYLIIQWFDISSMSDIVIVYVMWLYHEYFCKFSFVYNFGLL